MSPLMQPSQSEKSVLIFLPSPSREQRSSREFELYRAISLTINFVSIDLKGLGGFIPWRINRPVATLISNEFPLCATIISASSNNCQRSATNAVSSYDPATYPG